MCYDQYRRTVWDCRKPLHAHDTSLFLTEFSFQVHLKIRLLYNTQDEGLS